MKTCLIFVSLAAALMGHALPFGPLASPPKFDANTEVAVVDGHSVTVGEVRQMLDSAPPQIMQQFRQNPQMAIKTYFLIKYLSAEGDKAKLADQLAQGTARNDAGKHSGGRRAQP